MKGRFEAFSDGVFAIAITLLVLEIKVPPGDEPLVPRLVALWPSLAAYVASFLSIGIWWMAHHIVTHYVEAFDGGSLFLNLLLLMTIAFIPFPTAVLADRMSSGHDAAAAAVFYGIALLMPAIMGSVMLSYSRWRGHLRSAYDREAPRALTRYVWVGAVINAIGIAAAFVSPVAALAVFVASSCYWGVVTSAWRPRGAA